MTICHHQDPQVCAVGDRLLPELKKDQVKEPLEPPQQELIVNFLKKQEGFSKSNRYLSILQDKTTGAILIENGFVPLCEELARPRSIHRRIRVIEGFFAENPKLGHVPDAFVRLRGSGSDVLGKFKYHQHHWR